MHVPKVIDTDQQRRPFEHIPIGCRVCFAIHTTIFTDSGSIVYGDYGTRVESLFNGIHVVFDSVKPKIIQVARRQLHYPVTEF